MNYRIKFSVSIFFTVFLLRAQWSQLDGPTDYCIGAMATSGNTVIASTRYGIYSTIDNGTEWKKVHQLANIPNNFVNALAIKDSLLFVSTHNGLHRFVRNETGWIESDSLPISGVRCFYFKGDTILTGSSNGIRYSTDNGITWNLVDSSSIGMLVCIVTSGDTLLAGTQDDGLYRSTKNGVNLVRNGAFPFGSVTDLVKRNDTIYAGTFRSGIWTSTDAGNSWSLIDSFFVGKHVSSMILVEDTIFVSNYWDNPKGVFKAVLGNYDWKVINHGLPNYNVMTLTSKDTTIFAGTIGGVFKSTDYGETWIDVNSGLIREDKLTPHVALTVNGDDLYIGTYDGCYYSNDFGEKWECINSIRPNFISVINSKLFLGTAWGLFISSDKGRTWTLPQSGLEGCYVNAIVQTDTVLYTGTFSHGVFRSADGGENWYAYSEGLENQYINVLSYGNGTVYAATRKGLYKLPYDKSEWLPIYTNTSVRLLATVGEKVFALLDGIEYSEDKGMSWNWTGGKLPPSVAFIMNIHSTPFIGGGYGLFYSTNDGQSWDSLTRDESNSRVELCAANQDDVFIIANGNLWRKPVKEINGVTPVFKPDRFTEMSGRSYSDDVWIDSRLNIHFCLQKSDRVTIDIYQLSGKHVRCVENAELLPATYSYCLNTRYKAAGTYIVKIRIGQRIISQKVLANIFIY